MLSRKSFITGCLVLFTASAAAQDARPVLTLRDAVRMALEENRTIKIAENQARIAENDYSLGNAGMLPTFGMSAQQSLSSFRGFSGSDGNESRLATISTLDVAFNAGITLFDGFGQFATYRRLESQMDLMEIEAERTTEDVLASVVVAYYDLVRQQEQIEVQEEAIGISEERLRIAELRRDLGSASELEVRRAQVDLNADRATLLRQQVALSSSKSAFSRLLAREGGSRFQVSDTINVRRDLEPAQLRTLALQRNKYLGSARQAVTTAELSRDEERADWLPTVRLQAGYALNDFTEEIGMPAARPPGINYGLSATWGIFDGFNRKRRIENASIRLGNAQLLLEESRTELLTRLESAYENYRNSLTLVDLERENLGLASFNVEVALEQFRVGTITSVELREVQSAMTSAELRFITAQFEAARAQTQLLQLSGTLADSLAG